MSETKTIKCNKCQKEGLHWGTKQVKDKTFNILLEADGSEHRPYKDGKSECKNVPQNTQNTADKGQTPLSTDQTLFSILQGIGAIRNEMEALKKMVDDRLPADLATILEMVRSKLEE